MSITDIFYNEIVPKASKGKVDCVFLYNVIFNTITPTINFYSDKNDMNFQIPTFDIDSYLYLTLNDEIQCNNDFLYDLFTCNNYSKRK